MLSVFNSGIKIGWLCDYNLIDFGSLRNFSDFTCIRCIYDGCLNGVFLFCDFKVGHRFWSLNHNFLIEFNFLDFLRQGNRLSWLYKDWIRDNRLIDFFICRNRFNWLFNRFLIDIDLLGLLNDCLRLG